jgi:hypothetical protein
MQPNGIFIGHFGNRLGWQPAEALLQSFTKAVFPDQPVQEDWCSQYYQNQS